MSLGSGVIDAVDRLIGADAHQKRQRIKFLGSLLDDRSKGASGTRSLQTLSQKTGMTADACRALLAEMGCECVTDEQGREGWKRTKS